MDVIYDRCCGLDLHQRTVVACRLTPGPGGTPRREVQTFGTVTRELLRLGDWLGEAGVTHVAMESTGVYWKPVWNLLEDRFALLLVNAAQIKAVPGRKTDVKDAEWIADLLRHGLLEGSVVPDRPQRELQELTRYRTQLVHERSAEVNRLHKTLEGANIKLASVVSDITGVSARAMLTALSEGPVDPADLTGMARGQLRDKGAELERALEGRVGEHQRFMLRQHLQRIAGLEDQIATLSDEIETRLRPVQSQLTALDTIPGVGIWTAQVVLAELGTNLDHFPDAAHLVSWAGMCPRQDQSAGKTRSRRTRKGRPWLRVILTEAAYAAGRTKHGVLGERYRRLAKRRGRKRAAIAVGRMILELCYALLTTGACYEEPAPRADPVDAKEREQARLVRQLERLGNTVTLEPVAV